MDEHLTIGEAAARTGVSAHTLRYYERIGLIDLVERAASGHRRYAAADVDWIEFLTRLRSTGMPIRLMREFADLRRLGAETVRQRRELLEAHRREVEERVRRLEVDLSAIDAKIQAYRGLERDSAATAKEAGRWATGASSAAGASSRKSTARRGSGSSRDSRTSRPTSPATSSSSRSATSTRGPGST